jgi:hypothetical protein
MLYDSDGDGSGDGDSEEEAHTKVGWLLERQSFHRLRAFYQSELCISQYFLSARVSYWPMLPQTQSFLSAQSFQ